MGNTSATSATSQDVTVLKETSPEKTAAAEAQSQPTTVNQEAFPSNVNNQAESVPEIPEKKETPPLTIRSEQVRFRQLLKLITHGSQMDRACELMQELRNETVEGGGFLVRSDYDETKIRPELRVMQQCLLSENEKLVRLACEVYTLLEPNPLRFKLWFGITAEHVAWAKEDNSDDIDAQRIMALENLCTVSIVEDIRSLIGFDTNPGVRVLALRALRVLLLHPHNRSPTLFTEQSIRLLTECLPRSKAQVVKETTSGLSRRQIASVDYQRTCLSVLAEWSKCWMPVINASQATSGQGTTSTIIPLFCRALVLHLFDLIDHPNVDRECREMIITIVYFFSSGGLQIQASSDSIIHALVSQFLHQDQHPKTRFFTSLLLLTIAKANIEQKNESDMPIKTLDEALAPFVAEERRKGVVNKGSPPEAVAQGMLLACVVSFPRYDALMQSLLSQEVENATDVAFGLFMNRFNRSTMTFTCAWFVSKLSMRLLRLPKCVSLSFVLGLAHGELGLFDLIAAVLTRPNTRDFAIEAYNEGVAWFFQNSVSQFLFPLDVSARRLAVKCCKYLVGAFVSHHLEDQANLTLYDFFIARLMEMEELKTLCDERTPEARRTLRLRELSMVFDEDCQAMIYLLRLGVIILYRENDDRFERGAFKEVYSGEEKRTTNNGNEPERDNLNDDENTRRDPGAEEGGNQVDGLLGKTTDDNPWEGDAQKRLFLLQVIGDFVNHTADPILAFACGRALVSLIEQDEDAKRSVLVSGNLAAVLSSQSSPFTYEQLVVLRSLVKNAGGRSVWISLDQGTTENGVLQNRAGGRPAVFICSNDAAGVEIDDRTAFTKGQVVLLSQPRSLSIPNTKHVSQLAGAQTTRNGMFPVGARISHIEYGIGVILAEGVDGMFVEVSFDSGVNMLIHMEELPSKVRVLGLDEPELHAKADGKMSQWTMVFRVGSSFLDVASETEANSRIRVLCQGRNGDVHCGVLNKRLGCYDALNKRWHPSMMFLPDKSQTLVVVGRDKRTVFHLVDETGTILEFAVVDFQSEENVLAVGNGVKGDNPFGVLHEFILYDFAWDEHEFTSRLLPRWDPEFPRQFLATYNSGALVRKLRANVQNTISASTTERRLSALILANLALCPQVRTQILNLLGLDVETFLLDFSRQKESGGNDSFVVRNGGAEKSSLLDWESRSRLVSALI